MRGHIKFFKSDRGYGFITPDAGGGDIFVHARATWPERLSLNAMDAVEFDVERDDKGRMRAINVKRLNPARANAEAAFRAA